MMHEFYEEPRKLNMKKVILFSIICIILILCILFAIIRKISVEKKNETNEVKESSTIFYSADKSISIELSNHLKLEKLDSDSNYLLALHSPDDLNILVAKENSIPNRNLLDVVEADKIAFLSHFEKHSNLSETKELSVNNNTAYTYSFHYLDQSLNTAFYLQIVWLQIEDAYYIFDIEFPLDDLSFNTNIATSVLSSFRF